jgi:hypothetical protein
MRSNVISPMKLRSAFICLTLGFSLVACNSSSKSSDDNTSITSEKARGEDEIVDPNASTTDAPEGDPDTWQETYQGTLDGKIQVEMALTGQIGKSTRGTITYKSTGKPIMVLGYFSGDGNFFLREYQPDGLVTGVLSGSSKNGKLEGSWYSKGKELKLSMTTQTASKSAVWPYNLKGSIAGEYAYHYPDEGEDPGAAGNLTVKVKGDQVTFAFDCITGPPGYHMATMEETEATLEDGNLIRYSNSEYGECAFEIRFYQGFASVTHVDEKYDCGFGMNAGVEGDYVKIR